MVLPIDPILAKGPPLTLDELRQVLIFELGLLSTESVLLKEFQDYYDGEQAMVFGSEKFKTEFGKDFAKFRDNWCAPVVDALADKLVLEGLILGSGKEEIRTNADLAKNIWDVFRVNDIDQQQTELHESALIKGHGYVVCWPDDDLGVRIDWNPADVIRVRYADDDPRKIVWACKRWETASGRTYITEYTPTAIYKWQESSTQNPQGLQLGKAAEIPGVGPSMSFEQRNTPGEGWPLENPYGVVPVIEFLNKNGSELEDVIPLQNGVNYLMLQALTAAGFQGFPQRGMQTSAAAPVGGWKNSPGTVWHVPPDIDPDGKMSYGSTFEFTAASLDGFRGLIEMTLQHMALQTKTPVRMFMQSDRGGRGDAPSGESLLVEDQPLLDKVENRQRRFGNSWFKVAQLVARMDKSIAQDKLPLGEMRWHDPRSKYRSALVEEGSKMVDKMGLPVKFVITQLGLSPDEIEFLEREIDADKEAKMEEAEQTAQMEAKVAAANRPAPSPPTTPPQRPSR